MEIIVCAK